MKTISIRELHAKTGEIVRNAKPHGEIVVTDNGRAVARIIPEADRGALPYFARRKASAAFLTLDASGRTGRGHGCHAGNFRR